MPVHGPVAPLLAALGEHVHVAAGGKVEVHDVEELGEVGGAADHEDGPRAVVPGPQPHAPVGQEDVLDLALALRRRRQARTACQAQLAVVRGFRAAREHQQYVVAFQLLAPAGDDAAVEAGAPFPRGLRRLGSADHGLREAAASLIEAQAHEVLRHGPQVELLAALEAHEVQVAVAHRRRQRPEHEDAVHRAARDDGLRDRQEVRGHLRALRRLHLHEDVAGEALEVRQRSQGQQRLRHLLVGAVRAAHDEDVVRGVGADLGEL
mmetsp:Transcript_25985/g.82041  ORF Transcript_25985/g.82041 Transcript_25985/m.82041 type:complete len:264 (+) Transcript_25985:767-1558(+)